MRVHERAQPTNLAISSLTIAMHEELAKHDLTDGEYVMVVSNAVNSVLSGWAKDTIRMERHGNTGTPGGWAGDQD